MKQTDYLVVGAGIAGLTVAHLLSRFGSVLVITKGELKQANTYWAQGGIAAVLEKEDSLESHIKDTLETGCGHCEEEAVRHLVEHAPKAIRFLRDIGVRFQKEPALEAGHSRARVWRTSDFTGQDILDQLVKVIKKEKQVAVSESTDAVELIVHNGQCRGCFVRMGESETVEPINALHTILATGGCGQLFGRTTNTIGSGGDGLALAVHAGLELADMEFMQFHPTALAKPDNGRYFLLSETLRGFGARIVNHQGQPFLEKFDARGEMAPRDLLSRTVYFELMNGPVYLDMRHIDPAAVKKRFPNIYKRVKAYGFDLTKDLAPITPVAHYACGGVPTDLKGATKLPGLFAVGEVACTGVHGANRLASNSLLEAVVFSQAVAIALERSLPMDQSTPLDATIPAEPPQILIEPIGQVMGFGQRIGNIMWENAGIVRTVEGLSKAKQEIATIPARDYRVQHRQLVCTKIINACLNRPQSLGCHYMSDEIA